MMGRHGFRQIRALIYRAYDDLASLPENERGKLEPMLLMQFLTGFVAQYKNAPLGIK
jgi:hypothetical protein